VLALLAGGFIAGATLVALLWKSIARVRSIERRLMARWSVYILRKRGAYLGTLVATRRSRQLNRRLKRFGIDPRVRAGLWCRRAAAGMMIKVEELGAG
jgi:hypothetical protein